ncbi:hypothetical protein ACODG7_12190 [Vibrio anguillarum]|uniref:hypothetical protein n=1 Tax=Vibrio anguillarum TaxID=55601 RepID=UPI0002F0BA03|nr:hypothetical protein [Vibrio anguillarum]OEE42265.1 hypothetical protein A1QW_14050 [Vibrio anguillarum]OEF90723.1 hypothetical protein A1QY_02710 [Vibrio anguillarum]
MIFIIPFLLLFPKIGLFDVGVLILFIFSLLKGDKKFRIDPFVVSILLILSISLLSAIYNGGIITSEYALKPVRILLLYFSVTALTTINYTDVVKGIMVAVLVNSIMMYIQFFSELHGLPVYYNPEFIDRFDMIYRQPGFYSGYPEHSIIAACAFILLFREHKKLFYICLVFTMPSLLLSGRTGIYALLVGVALYLFFLSFRKPRLLIYLTTFLISLYLILYFVKLFEGYFNPQIIFAVEHILLPIQGVLSDSGRLGDYSTDDLINNHYFLPDDWHGLLIGNSLPPFDGGVKSDVSFIRIIFGNGIFSLILYLFCFAFLARKLFLSNKIGTSEAFIIVFIFLVSIFKGPFLFSRIVGDVFIILCVLARLPDSNVLLNKQLKVGRL